MYPVSQPQLLLKGCAPSPKRAVALVILSPPELNPKLQLPHQCLEMTPANRIAASKLLKTTNMHLQDTPVPKVHTRVERHRWPPMLELECKLRPREPPLPKNNDRS